MDFTVNANLPVKVQLTVFGIEILQERHNTLREQVMEASGSDIGEFELRVDENGYYHDALWSIMNKFGQYLNFGYPQPFSMEIIMTGGTPVQEGVKE